MKTSNAAGWKWFKICTHVSREVFFNVIDFVCVQSASIELKIGEAIFSKAACVFNKVPSSNTSVVSPPRLSVQLLSKGK